MPGLDQLFPAAENQDAMSGGPLIRFGVYELDAEAQELRREGRLIRLTPQALRLLVVLTEAPAIVASRERLRAALWADDTHVDFDRSLNSAIRKLRAALHDEADRPRYVQTIPGRGYRFIAPVERIERAEREPRVREAQEIAPLPLPLPVRVAAPSPHVTGGHHAHVALAACLAGAIVLGSIVAVQVITVMVMPMVMVRPVESPAASLQQIPVTVRLGDPSSSGAPGSDRLLIAVRDRLRRLDPVRLVITDEHAAEAGCHEVVLSADDTRVAAQLLDRCRQEQSWAEIVDAGVAPASGRDAVHQRIVSAISRAVADRLLPGDAEARVRAATTSDRAIEAYRRGQAANGERLAQLSEAIEVFSMAVRIDPGFAPAWAALAHARASRAMLDGRDASEFRRAREEAERARTADDTLADAHLALGQVSFSLDADTRGAEIAMRRAKALGAAAGDQLWLAWVLNAGGRDAEALRVIDEALTHEPRSALLHAWRGLLLHALRRYDEEIAELRHAVSLDDQSWEAVLHLGLGYSRRMQYDLALPALRRAVALSDTAAVSLAWLGRVSADAGDVASAERIAAQLRALAPARGLSPSLGASVSYHIEAHRRTALRPSS